MIACMHAYIYTYLRYAYHHKVETFNRMISQSHFFHRPNQIWDGHAWVSQCFVDILSSCLFKSSFNTLIQVKLLYWKRKSYRHFSGSNREITNQQHTSGPLNRLKASRSRPVKLTARESLFLLIDFCAFRTNSSGFEDSVAVNSGTETCKKPNWFPHGDWASGFTISSTDLYPLMFLVFSNTSAVECALAFELWLHVCIYNLVPKKIIPQITSFIVCKKA